MKMNMKTTLTITACLLLSSCGFQPIYSDHKVEGTDAQSASFRAQFSDIYIDNIPDREGQYLRNALIDRFYTQGRVELDNAEYILQIEPIKESRVDLDITKTSDATRAQLRVQTVMQLIDPKDKKKVLERTLRSISSYNVLDSEFATRVSEQTTRENALDDLARQIELQIALHFQGQ